MQKTDVKLFRKFDILVFALVAALAVTLFFAGMKGEGDGKLVVNSDGIESVYFLNKNQEIPIECNEIKLTVVIKDGEAFVKDSKCKDKICVHSGKISHAGQIIVCAPAKVSIRIDKDGGEYDGITG